MVSSGVHGWVYLFTQFWGAGGVLKTAAIRLGVGQFRVSRAWDYNSARKSSRMTVGRSVNRNFFSPVTTGLFTIQIQNHKAGIPL